MNDSRLKESRSSRLEELLDRILDLSRIET